MFTICSKIHNWNMELRLDSSNLLFHPAVILLAEPQFINGIDKCKMTVLQLNNIKFTQTQFVACNSLRVA